MQKLTPRKLQELQALLQQGLRMLQEGDARSALLSYEAATRIAPRHFDVLHMQGVAHAALGAHARAAELIGLALRLKPDSGRAQLNYAVALRSLGDNAAALPHLKEAARLLPGDPTVWFNLGNAWRDAGDAPRAVQSYEKALQIAPDAPDSLNNLALLHAETENFPAAAACLARLIDTGAPLPWLPGRLQHTRARYCDWQDYAARAATLLARVESGEPVSSPFALFSLPASAQQLLAAARARVAAEFPPRASCCAHTGSGQTRIRLAYISADMHEHATAYLMAELFELHDRARFEVFVFAFNSPADNPMRARLSRAVDHFEDISALSDADAASLIAARGIDIAIDLKGFTRNARTGIFAHRPAPLQVNYLGFPGSMGAPYIDYIVADAVLAPPGAEQHYDEKLIRLPGCYQPNDRQRPIATDAGSRSAHGLPEEGFVFCCFNNNFKITPDVFAIWMRLLHQCPGSVLWLFEDNPHVAARLRDEARAQGIDPVRLVFAPSLPLPEHLARHRHADLFIDTFWCNAHTTASDALWAGLPLVTLAGESFAARVAASLLSAAGLSELITTSAEAYEALCLELATQPQRLAALRTRLHETRDTLPLFDTPRYTRQLEAAWQAIHARRLAGLAPDHIDLTA